MWMDISLAPLDGTKVFVWEPYADGVTHIKDEHGNTLRGRRIWAAFEKDQWVIPYSNGMKLEPTLFQHLPEAPNGKA